MPQKTTPGTLYIVSTPIGNLEDITLRAIRILKEVTTIAAEDTRQTGKLLAHFQINTPMTSYHDFNKEGKTPVFIQRMQKGDSFALVSDAGTPSISDPGYYLIRTALSKDIPVCPIPGPVALIAALSVSGLPTDRFVFEGFLARKKGKRDKQLEALKDEPRTLIFYESPYRIISLLNAILTLLGDREIVIARELTKLHEETIKGSVSQVLNDLKTKKFRGEASIVVEGYRPKKQSQT